MTGLNPTSRPPIMVKQGPGWLVHLLYHPPGWLGPVVGLLAALVFATVAYRLYQADWRIPIDRQLEMGKIAGTIIAVLISTLAMVNLADQPYLVDVGVGFLVGYGAVTLATSGRTRAWAQSYIEDPHDRAAAGWFVLAAVALLGPSVLPSSAGIHLFTARLGIVGLATLLTIYNTVEAKNADTA